MTGANSKYAALLETVLVFGLVVLVFKIIQHSPVGRWEAEYLPGRMIEYGVVILLSLLLILLRGAPGQYGLSFRLPRQQFSIAAISFIPFFLVSLTLHFIGWATIGRAAVVAFTEVAVFLILTRLLRNKGLPPKTGIFAVFLPVMTLNLPLAVQFGFLARLVYSLLFAALGEEIFFRGYLQSRLNGAFGRPFCWSGFQFGWGWLAAGIFFSAWHILIPFNPFQGVFQLAWGWGLWTFFLGLLLGFMREKTGTIIIPAFLHYLINL